MTARTRILGTLLALLMVAAVIGVHYLNEAVGRILVGLLAGWTLANVGQAMARTFTAPQPQNIHAPRR